MNLGVTLNHVPLWSQQKDGDPTTGGQAANWANNCGPESLAVCVSFFSGVELWAEIVKDVLYGQSYTGYTDWDHLTRYLGEHCGCPAGVYTTTDADTALQHLRAYLDRGHIALALFYENVGAQTGGHYSPVYAYTADSTGRLLTVTRMNVWNAVAESMSVEQFRQAYNGGIMELHRQRSVIL